LTTTAHTGYGAAILLGDISYIKQLKVEFDYKYTGTPYGDRGEGNYEMSSFSLSNGILNSTLFSSSYHIKYNSYQYPYMSSFVKNTNYRHVVLEVNNFNSITTTTHVLTDGGVLRGAIIKTSSAPMFLLTTEINKSSYTAANYKLDKPLYLTFYLGDYWATSRPMNVTVKDIKIYVKVDSTHAAAFNASANNAYVQQ
jgi:hypothetical protein